MQRIEFTPGSAGVKLTPLPPSVSFTIRFFLILLALTSLAAAAPVVLGRCPLEKVTGVSSGRFCSPDTDDLLVVQDLGRIELSRGPGQDRIPVNLGRLSVLRMTGTGLRTAWQSEPLTAGGVPAAGVVGTCWTSGDVDGDKRTELLLFTAESCRIVSFGPDSTSMAAFNLGSAWTEGAAVCDIDDDGVPEVATLELSSLDSAFSTRLLRLYRISDASAVPLDARLPGVNWGPDLKPAFTGAARLDDYPGALPVIAGVYSTLRPSSYAVVFSPAADSFALTTKPFPWQEWFSRTRVLPAGELSLFNVGDTLVAYGYFVPGTGAVPSRGQSPRSFAALEDGEWRLLPLTADAARLSGPVCRFTKGGAAGWLELRDNLFYFYPGEVFRWR